MNVRDKLILGLVTLVAFFGYAMWMSSRSSETASAVPARVEPIRLPLGPGSPSGEPPQLETEHVNHDVDHEADADADVDMDVGVDVDLDALRRLRLQFMAAS